MTLRYAVYFVPDDQCSLAEFGQSILQRSATGQTIAAPAQDHPQRVALIQKAQVYGFHATLKAPFRIAKGVSEDQLFSICGQIAKRHSSIPLIGLDVLNYRGFCALALPTETAVIQPSSSGAAHQRVSALALDCVLALEPCREPLSDQEIARRKPDQLSQRQREHLREYGYPYVADQYSFHMTLSSKLEDRSESRLSYLDWAKSYYQTLVCEAPVLDRIALCVQPAEAEQFHRVKQWRLA
ncbi:MAG: DUF1045 domain-containing protein [Gammaproteobacteria bacterium]|nr:DUF1045 domain-containing protein [Gammaproteobacteria bacterium]